MASLLPENKTREPLVMHGRRGDVEIVESDEVDTQQLRDFLLNGFGERRETWGKKVGKRLAAGLGKIAKKAESDDNDPENNRIRVHGGGIIRRTLL